LPGLLPGQDFAPVFDTACETHSDVVFGKVKTDEVQDALEGAGEDDD
jgi:hypothetical protein